MEILIPLAMIGLFAATVFFTFRSASKIRKEFPRWAEELGWTPKPLTSWTASPEAEGVHNGRPGRIYTYATGSGKSRTTWAAVELRGEGAPGLELAFTRQGFGTKVASLFGAKEVEVGDAAFDARWFIRTNRPEFVKAALLPEVRARIDELTTRGGRGVRLEFTGGKAVYAEQGGFNAAVRARVAAALPVLADLVALAEVERTN